MDFKSRNLTVLLLGLLAFLFSSTVRAKEQKVCHRQFETAFNSTVIKGCEKGDVLFAQISKVVAPAFIVSRYCGLDKSIFTETHPITKEVSVVCEFVNGRKER